MAIVQILIIGRSERERIDTARRRSLIPRKPGQRIDKACRGRFKVFDKSGLSAARVGVMTATGKFCFDTPVRGCRSLDTRDGIHQVREGLYRILQAEVKAPQEAGIRFVSKSRDFGRRALALVKGGHTKDRTCTKAVQVKRQFSASAQKQFVINFEHGFAFELDLDFLVRVKSAFTQEFNLSKFIVDFVVRTTDKRCRTGSHLFGPRRNIHTATAIDGVARIRVTHANHGITALTDRFKIELACVTAQVVNRQVIELLHRGARIQVAQRFQAVLLRQFQCV